MESVRVRVVGCRYANGDINDDAQHTLQIITLLVPQEVSNSQNGEDQHNQVETLKVEAHGLVKSPADDNHKGAVEQSGLQRRTQYC